MTKGNKWKFLKYLLNVTSSPPSLNVQKVHEEFIQNIETGIPHPGTLLVDD